MVRRSKKSKNRILMLLLLILSITIGFALLSTTLKINGFANVKGNRFDIHWDESSIVETEGSNEATTPATVIDQEKKNISFAVELRLPGQFYEFTVDAVNSGTIAAEIDTIELNYYPAGSDVPTSLPEHLEYKIEYANGGQISPGDLLKPGKSIKYRVRFGYKSSIDKLKEDDDDGSVELKIIPKAKHSEKCPAPESFSSDDWNTIACNVRKGNTDAYNIGDTKSVDLETLGTHTVRLANKSTPNGCSGEGFSQTACGFVVEFTDVIVNHRFNPFGDFQDSPDGFNNKGGWKYSDIRAYMNNGLYEYEHIDYQTTGLYNKFPEDLRDVIIDTKVVSGHGASDTANFTTTDKLFLLGTMEVYGSNPGGYDTAADQTRQFDYYSSIGVTTNNYSGANKNGSNWWLRSVDNGTTRQHYVIGSAGTWGFWYSNSDAVGISPAFKIG